MDLPASPPRVLAAIAAARAARRMKPAPFAYARPADWPEALAACWRRARGRAPARSRSGRCSTFGWRSPTPSPTCAICRTMPAWRPTGGVRAHRRRHDACGDRGWRGAGPARRDHGRRRARHRLSPGAQPRHDRRQPGACRSRRPTGSRCCRRSAPRRSRSGPAASGASRSADFVTGIFETALARRRVAARGRAAGAAGRRALGALEVLPQAGRVLQGHGLRAGAARPGAARRAGRAGRAAAGDRGRLGAARRIRWPKPRASWRRFPELDAWRAALAATALRRAVELARRA